MKLSFLIIILSFIGSILNSDYEYDLKSGSSVFVGTLEKSTTYKFYISALYRHKVYIEFIKRDSSSTSNQNINIYEYSNRSSTSPAGWTSYNYLSYSSSTNSYSYLYMVKYSTCNYLAFEIKPLYTMTSTYVKATFIYEYDLNIGTSSYYQALTTSYIYIFYLPVKYPQTINIEFKKNDSSSSSSQYITISELSSKASSSIRWESYNLNYNSSTNSYSTSYKINYRTCNYLAFEILPDYNMNSTYVKATAISPVHDYDLTSGSSEYFSTLSNAIIYKFYIPAKNNQKVNFKLTGYSSSLDSFTIYIYIYEYSRRDSISELSKKSINFIYSSSTDSYSYSYTISDSSCHYAAFEIKPDKDLSRVFVKATLETKSSWVVEIILILIISIVIISLLVWYYVRKTHNKEISFENTSTLPLNPLQPV